MRWARVNTENVVYIPQPQCGFGWKSVDKFLFEFPHEQVGVVGGHFSAHRCSADLMVNRAVEFKIIERQNEAYKSEDKSCRWVFDVSVE